MADLTTTTHVAVAVGGAIAGAVLVAVAAPLVIPLMGLGAAGILVTGSAATIGTALGGWLGWQAGTPTPATVQKLVSMN